MEKKSLYPSPFPDSLHNPHVQVVSGKDAYKNTIQALSDIDLTTIKGKKVLLKPNAGRIANPGSGITTNPQVVAAAIDTFHKAGARVAVGESPITGVNVIEAFESSGIASVVRERNCPLLDMDVGQPAKTAIRDGIVIQSIKVCSVVFDYDIVVSIPVMKTHMHTGVTLAIKNMKGCLWRRSKVELHMLSRIEGIDDMPLDIAIADMSSILRPSLSIIDGTTGMEGLGPSAGEAKRLDVIVTGIDSFAVDSIACSLMGLDANKVPHLRIGAERGYGVIDISRIKVSPDTWRESSSPFKPPPLNLSIQFPGITILDEQSCSACQSTLLLFLKRYGEELFDYFPGKDNLTIAIGKGHKSVSSETLCIGNCANQHRNDCIFVPGCPPVASQILKVISTQNPKSNPK
ncbi:MAG: DUF362 domain-containing protein [Spirochaetota bacterium]|nr:DUF362 domain-containing protein [Spirochaetota bacterium]